MRNETSSAVRTEAHFIISVDYQISLEQIASLVLRVERQRCHWREASRTYSGNRISHSYDDTIFYDTGPQRRSGPLKPEKALESPIFIDWKFFKNAKLETERWMFCTLLGRQALASRGWNSPSFRQAPLSMGFFRQEYWSRLPFPSPRDLPNPVMEPRVFWITGRFFIAKPPGKPKFPLAYY